MGLIHPTAGSASVLGLDCQRQSVAVKRVVGYLPGELPQFGPLRGSEVIAYLAGLRGGVDLAFARSLAARFDLDLGRRFREYSRGNKQKLGLVIAFMHRPQVLVLDEPTGGLDPLNQQEFYELVRETSAAGSTVFLSSHVLSEVEHVCRRVGIIREGRLVKVAELSELHEIRSHRVTVELDQPPPVERLRAAAGVDDLEVDGNRFHCTIRGSFAPFMAALEGSRVLNLTSHEPSLEEIFLTYYR